jgi:predicted SnoaL-like aldol condensation-catalyzing enzyme
MKSTMKLFAGALVLAVGVGRLPAESINPPTTPQTAPMDKQEKKNLDMVLEWWRVVIQNRQMDQAAKYQAEDYIQHNPNVNTGRAAFVAFFSKLPKPNVADPSKLANQPVVKGAKGDFVWLIWETEQRIRAIRRKPTTPTASTFCASRTAKSRSTGTARRRCPAPARE